jgi:hypothetical protein
MNSEKGGGDEGEREEGQRGKNLVAKYHTIRKNFLSETVGHGVRLT